MPVSAHSASLVPIVRDNRFINTKELHVDATNSNFFPQNSCALTSSPSRQEVSKVVAISITRLAEIEPSRHSEGKRDHAPTTYSARSSAICDSDDVMVQRAHIGAEIWDCVCRQASGEGRSKYKWGCRYTWKVICCSKDFAFDCSHFRIYIWFGE